MDDNDKLGARLLDVHRQLRERDDAVVFLQEEIDKRDAQIDALRQEVARGAEVWQQLEELRATRAVRWGTAFWALKVRVLQRLRRSTADGT